MRVETTVTATQVLQVKYLIYSLAKLKTQMGMMEFEKRVKLWQLTTFDFLIIFIYGTYHLS